MLFREDNTWSWAKFSVGCFLSAVLQSEFLACSKFFHGKYSSSGVFAAVLLRGLLASTSSVGASSRWCCSVNFLVSKQTESQLQAGLFGRGDGAVPEAALPAARCGTGSQSSTDLPHAELGSAAAASALHWALHPWAVPDSISWGSSVPELCHTQGQGGLALRLWVVGTGISPCRVTAGIVLWEVPSERAPSFSLLKSSCIDFSVLPFVTEGLQLVFSCSLSFFFPFTQKNPSI